ncbi:hypothetical protein SAMN05444397_102232 [Flavobacterium aquidurense]|nr:hypothetical protein SAMN05444397_102232 [Flavobacterium aquidurense]
MAEALSGNRKKPSSGNGSFLEDDAKSIAKFRSRLMFWKNIKSIVTNYFLPQRTQSFLSNNALEYTEFAKLN